MIYSSYTHHHTQKASATQTPSVLLSLKLICSMLRKREVPSAKAIFSAAASATATAILIRTLTREYVPEEVRVYLRGKLFSLFSSVSPSVTVTIDEYEGLAENQLFRAAEVYLGTKISPSTRRFRASIPPKEKQVVLTIDRNLVMVDVFEGVEFRWKKFHKEETKSSSKNSGGERARASTSYLELSFDKQHRDLVLNSYFPHILSESFTIKHSKKTPKIHMLSYRGSGKPWTSTTHDHPSTFDTLAMDPEAKKTIMDDLDMFVRRKEFYRKVGKAWKRGYLLFGPPGTGKSSLIAAIANYLKFDIYDLELTDLGYNSELRKLILATANRSILVVEDIDCSVDLDPRKKQVNDEGQQEIQMKKPQITLSGLLNFIDGLWSCCGDERIIVFTTNHKERLDPALLRPGRMDVHIHMSYCTPCGFRMLASNYHGLIEHPLFVELDQLVAAAKVTPAEVAEQLMRAEHPETALKGLLEFLKLKKDKESKMSDVVEEPKLDDAKA